MTGTNATHVLREVVVRGHRVLGRPVLAGAVAQAGAPFIATATDVSVDPLAQAFEEARRRGYEVGREEGLVDGRRAGLEEAKRAADLAAEEAQRELDMRAARLRDELAQQAETAYQSHLQMRIEVLENLIVSLNRRIEERVAAADDDAVALCAEVIGRVLGEEAVRPSALREQLARAMDRLGARALVAIHMHPQDLANLERIGLPRLRPQDREVRWVASPEVALGGCLLESPEGGLDARIETQLEALREAIFRNRGILAASAAVDAHQADAP